VTTVLLTLGRLPRRSIWHGGLQPGRLPGLVAEPFGRTLTGALRHVAREFGVPPPSAGKASYLAAIAKIVKDEDVDLVVPVSEETMHVAFARDLFDPRVRLFTMPSDQVIALHDKAEFVRIAQAIGLGVPETHTLGTGGAQALAQTGECGWRSRCSHARDAACTSCAAVPTCRLPTRPPR